MSGPQRRAARTDASLAGQLLPGACRRRDHRRRQSSSSTSPNARRPRSSAPPSWTTWPRASITLDGDGCVTYMNRAAVKMLGWTEAELRGQPMHAADPLPAGRRLACVPTRTARAQGPHPKARTVRVADEAFTRKDGTIFPVAYSSAPLRVGSSIREAPSSCSAISPRNKETQARVQRELAALSWVGRIRDALDEDRLVLYSQPIVPLGGGKPERRAAAADDRADPARSSCPAASCRWPRSTGSSARSTAGSSPKPSGSPPPGRRVEVNLSAASIGTLDLLPFIERELHETGADPANLVFEITETALMHDIDAGEAFARGPGGPRLPASPSTTSAPGSGASPTSRSSPSTTSRSTSSSYGTWPPTPPIATSSEPWSALAHGFRRPDHRRGRRRRRDPRPAAHRAGVDFAQGFHLGRPAPVAPHQGPARMEFPGLRIDTGTRQVIVDGRQVEFTRRGSTSWHNSPPHPGTCFPANNSSSVCGSRRPTGRPPRR